MLINENNITKEHNKIKKTFLSPLVLNIMKLNNLSTKDIIKIKGSGNNGRITKKDILHFVKEKNIKINKNNTTISTSYDNNKLITKMSPMRKSISEHMIASKQISAHVTTFFDVDYTKINLIKNKYKKLFFQEEEVPLTYTVFLVCAVSQVLKRHKYINASIKKNHIIFNNNINLGIAVFISSPDPGLIVPVIKNCDQMNLRGIANAIYHLSKQARKNKTSIESLSEATFTISNPGNYGSITGTPIINQPQVAILGIGKIKKRLTITEINKSDVISIKNIGIISLSFDHRLIDGVTADIFMSDLKATLENWTTTP